MTQQRPVDRLDHPAAPVGLRALRDDDADAVIALVSAAYAEYPGCVLDLPGVDDDLPVLARRWADAGGGGWVVERDGEVVACVGWAPTGPGTVELKRLYVAAAARGAGLGAALVAQVVAAANGQGARWLELWSDTRFEDAHRLYERLGFARLPGTRDLHDPSDTTEFHYVRDLAPAEPGGAA